MDGYLLVNKPKGISSFGVVSKVRGVWRAELRTKDLSPKKAKVGHTGTLDPLAEGLLLLVLGSYTKKAANFSKMDKLYEVEITLGAVSTTGDQEGSIETKSHKKPSSKDINVALSKFEGQIMQHPPIYSAIKINGKRAYKLARAGEKIKIEARPVLIHSIRNIEYNYPKLTFTTHVGSGTYIRSLAEDIGHSLGTGAYMSQLKRVGVGEHSLGDAIDVENLNYQQLLKALRN
jgi:tRNA pseudouridine55 synthase